MLGLKNVFSNGIKGYHGVSIATNLEVESSEQKDFCKKKRWPSSISLP